MSAADKPAIDGGTPVRTEPIPPRGLMTEAEKQAVVELFDEAIAEGGAFGYSGPRERQFEADFVEFMGGGFADGVNSGSNAVYCALGALRLEPFSEVIVSAITDPGGIMPIALLGCVPVVADTDGEGYNTCAEQIEPLITERTRALVIPPIMGEAVDMDPILALAKKHDLYVVEDCAQSHGALYKGRMVGTMGDIAAFSTMFGKHFSTGGQGGVVYTHNEDLHWEGRRFADRGKPFHLDEPGNVRAGINCNLNEIGATIGSVQVKRLPAMIAHRRKLGEAVKEGMKDGHAVKLGRQVPQTQSSYWYLRVKLELDALTVDKQQFCRALKAEGIPCMDGYPGRLWTAPWLRTMTVFGEGGFPWTCSDYKGPRRPVIRADNAEQAMLDNIPIPIHENYGLEIADQIVAALKKLEKAYKR
ncbi:MAG: hypothetical protein GXY85_11085 [Candidatus Brocadiaceae bacterium]|nr:hypothetical protein [Candidatus Brocadiaceae bacterium]